MMEELIIHNFKYGLDTRKEALSSLLGTLVVCENCSVNPGGELEKRKGFSTADNNATVLDTLGNTGTFGIEVTDAGLTIFGSALPSTASVTQGQPKLLDSFVILIYQQLKHPTLVNDSTENYVVGKHRMTQVVFSLNFNGKAFVAAKFADGRTFLYYDGALVQHSANGIVLDGRIALSDLANDLLRQFQAIEWTGEANVDENGVAQNGSVIIKSPPLNKFTPIPEETATAGLLGFKAIAQDGASVAGTRPLASFGLLINTGTFAVSAPYNADGTGTADISGGAIAALGSLALTAAAIASAINDLTFITGYSASSDSVNVNVYAPESFGPSFVFNLSIDHTTVAAVGATVAPAPPFMAHLADNPLIKTISIVLGVTEVTAEGSAVLSGGTGPYSYTWSETLPGSGKAIKIVGPTNQNTIKFSLSTTRSNTPPIFPIIPIDVTGSFRCQVADNAGATAQLILTVRLAILLQ